MRRFGRKIRDGSTCLLPTIDLPPSLLKGRARGLIQAMRIREELSPASFSEADALVVLQRLKEVFAEQVARGDDLRQPLREVVRPAYRNVLELLSGRRASKDGLLKQAPLLAQDGQGQFQFPGRKSVFYVDRRDTHDRLQTDYPVWTCVLEAFAAGRGALAELFGCRVLEESFRWSPQVGDPSFSEAEKLDWRLRLRELAPMCLPGSGLIALKRLSRVVTPGCSVT